MFFFYMYSFVMQSWMHGLDQEREPKYIHSLRFWIADEKNGLSSANIYTWLDQLDLFVIFCRLTTKMSLRFNWYKPRYGS